MVEELVEQHNVDPNGEYLHTVLFRVAKFN